MVLTFCVIAGRGCTINGVYSIAMLQHRAFTSCTPKSHRALVRPLIAKPTREQRCARVQAADAAEFATQLVNSLPIPAQQLFATGISKGAALSAAGAVLAAIVGTSIYILRAERSQRPTNPAMRSPSPVASSFAPLPPPPPPRENAVLVLGATGRVGRRLTERLIKAGRTVVAAARSADGVRSTLGAAGLKEGRQEEGQGVLFVEGVDVTSVDSLKRQGLWEGVTQVVSVVGGKFGPLPEGGFGVIDGMTSEVVEAGGLSNLVSVLPEVMPKRSAVQLREVVPMGSQEQVAVWERLDDVIMGGNSSSQVEYAPEEGPTVSRWKGDLVLEGGGFCGTRTKALDACNLSGYDGIALRVKGDGQIFKLNIKTLDQLGSPESTYQTTFDTVAGQWSEVLLPWDNFVSVKRAQSDPKGTPLDPSKIATFGLVLSRFEFNKMPNPVYKPGPFELLIDGGVRAYKAPRPQLVTISSAGVERNAIIGDDAEARKRDIPIVQLNPGGTLNHKYAAELAVRASGYPYAVVRFTGLIDSQEGGPFLLEADQGDVISGSVGRDEAADTLAAVLASPQAVGKTFEVRRNKALDGRGRAMTPADYNRMLLRLALDRNRWRVGLQPFPKYSPPPAPITEDRTKEIVAEVARVREQQQSALSVKAGTPPAAAAAPSQAGGEKAQPAKQAVEASSRG